MIWFDGLGPAVRLWLVLTAPRGKSQNNSVTLKIVVATFCVSCLAVELRAIYGSFLSRVTQQRWVLMWNSIRPFIVRPSVRMSVTFRYRIETAEHHTFFSTSHGSPIILVFPVQIRSFPKWALKTGVVYKFCNFLSNRVTNLQTMWNSWIFPWRFAALGILSVTLIRPATLSRFRDFATAYKSADLLTYLLTHTMPALVLLSVVGVMGRNATVHDPKPFI